MWAFFRHLNYYEKKFFFSSGVRMSRMNIIFYLKKWTRAVFVNKKVFNIYDIVVDKILVSKKEAYGKKKSSFKYFLGYNDDDDDAIRPLRIELPQMIGYFKHFNSNKTMSFKVNNKRLLKCILKYEES